MKKGAIRNYSSTGPDRTRQNTSISGTPWQEEPRRRGWFAGCHDFQRPSLDAGCRYTRGSRAGRAEGCISRGDGDRGNNQDLGGLDSEE